MNIILFEKDEIFDNQIVLTDHRATHIVKILKADIGSRLKVGIINQGRGTGEITEIHKKRPHRVHLTVSIDEKQFSEPQLDLILALPRPIMLRRILSQVTALGVGHIYLINANRVEKSFWDASLLQPEEYREHLKIGLEQCTDTRLPTLSLHDKFRPFIEDLYPTVQKNYKNSIVADPTGTLKICEVVKEDPGKTVLAVGPEGGWVDFEMTKFNEQKFSVCNIGRRILKVDTAVVALHGHLSAFLDV